MNRWQFWVDRGGTFTDVVARAPDGRMARTKLLSEDPDHYDDAAIAAIRQLTRTPTGALPPCDLRIGTTVATNALLERKGARVALAITRGFGDALRIGTQERPELFARAIVLPEPLYEKVVEIDERVLADGTIERPLDETGAERAFAGLRTEGFDAIAIVLMHGWQHRAHEAGLARIARRLGFAQVSVSHELAPLVRLIGRGDTCVLDAYVSPALDDYVARLRAGLGAAGDALFMQSGGGLTDGDSFHGKDAILSGPAGGIVAMAATAREAGFQRVVGFDMGGTSTDVSYFAGRYERDSESRLEGVRIRAPMMRIHTVAAGGGSVCRFDGRRFRVGPQSAGAAPGPACYRRGGPLTITDCNLALGRLHPDYFPHVFGPEANLPPDVDAARERLSAICREVKEATGRTISAEEAAEGFLEIAVANMAQAIKAISIRRGHDLDGAALASFGGAGGQHGCRLASALGMQVVQCHPLAGVLSAYGMGLADRRTIREATLGLALDDDHATEIAARIETLAEEAEAELAAAADAPIEHEKLLMLRPQGSENTIEVPFGPVAAMRSHFARGWRERFGFAIEGAIIAESARVEAIEPSAHGDIAVAELPERSSPPERTVEMWESGRRQTVPLYRRDRLTAGFAAEGPLLVVDPVSTTVVEAGWRVTVDGIGNLLLRRSGGGRAPMGSASTARDPVRLEIMGALFMGIAEEMGAALQQSASSVNIRERLDFSCALFDRAGNLVANAPHMPVHLGSMGESVRAVLRRRAGDPDGRGLRPGDAYALNAPYEGGTHLPDITVVMPVFATDDPQTPAWFVAARGHHADIGGTTPGSMPPDSRSIAEEGVLLDDVLLVDEGHFRDAELRAILSNGPFPARNPERNIADLKAQLAACAKGAGELLRLGEAQGRPAVDAYMEHVQSHAEEAVRALLDRLGDGHFRYEMDNGAAVEVTVRIDRAAQSAQLDFAGTSPQLPGNFNAPLPIVRAAVLYAVRTLIEGEVPMNEGCLRPLTISVPEGSMLNPRPPAAVVAGNVETSQTVTDAIFGALGAMAGAQGTMNNLTFGNARHQYYETIAGGSGAGPGFAGADAVQTHMTNSRLTDPEVLEGTYPVVLESFAIRRGSGGDGRWRGGDGVVRRLRFRETMDAGILANRRRVPPFGLAGGAPGACGVNRIIRASGDTETLGSCAALTMNPGDRLEIATPGGGGYGAADAPPSPGRSSAPSNSAPSSST